jgi:hypothetical protein
MATCDPRYYSGLQQMADPYQNDLLKAYEKMTRYAETYCSNNSLGNCMPRKEKNMNMKLLAKKLLSPDLRTLIKAGILNDDLSIANCNFILEFYVNKHLKELAAEAKAKMAELKAEQDEE